jgi:hypothetical protein
MVNIEITPRQDSDSTEARNSAASGVDEAAKIFNQVKVGRLVATASDTDENALRSRRFHPTSRPAADKTASTNPCLSG